MSERDMDVLNILWGHEEPMQAMDIAYAVEGLNQSTVTAVLRKLLEANMVEVAGVTHSGKVLSRIYRPTEASKEAVIDFMMAELKRCESVVTLDDLQRAQQK